MRSSAPAKRKVEQRHDRKAEDQLLLHHRRDAEEQKWPPDGLGSEPHEVLGGREQQHDRPRLEIAAGEVVDIVLLPEEHRRDRHREDVGMPPHDQRPQH